MKLKVFSVFDSKVQAYARPFYLRTLPEAVRSFQAACDDSRSELSQHPEDYSLTELGEYDDETGMFTNLRAPINHGTAAVLRVPPKAGQQVDLVDRLNAVKINPELAAGSGC